MPREEALAHLYTALRDLAEAEKFVLGEGDDSVLVIPLANGTVKEIPIINMVSALQMIVAEFEKM